MNKGVTLFAALWCLAGASALAQSEVADSAKFQDNADFTFSESQLDDDVDNAQPISAVAAKYDPYLNAVGFRFSPMRFRVRGFDNQYNNTYINGLRLNDTELGRFNYSSIGGMNDATRNREAVDAYEYNTFGLAGIGGAQSINSRASQFARGNRLTLSATNRNYYGRLMATHATGLLKNGWAFAGSVGYRGALEGVIEGTFYNSLSYFFAVEKRLNNNHALSLVTYGAPTERAQQGASTEEAYWLANSHYYNPNWGYQNGEKRNARVVESFAPTTILTWDWKDDNQRTRATTNVGFVYSKYSNTSIGWNGDAADPRPDYYKNLPSSIFDVWDAEKNNATYLGQNPFLLEQYNSLRQRWSTKAGRQIDWDQMYYINRQNEAAGGEALYYLERRHNDQAVGLFSTTLNHDFDARNKIALGLYANHTHAMHYKTMADLLGGTRYTDIDKFAVNDYGPNSQEAQNDLRHPNRQIAVGDTFGYDYNIDITKGDLWTNYQHTARYFYLSLAAHLEGTVMERDGKMLNGRYANNSYGKSGDAKFLGGGGKMSLAYTPNGNHRIVLSAGYDKQAPLARNAFVAARAQNNYVDRLTNEDLVNADLGYTFRVGRLSGKVSAYYAVVANAVEQSAFYNDQQSTFTYLTMSNVDKEHYGIEAALNFRVTSNFSINALASVGEARYTNNPYAQVSYEGMNSGELQKLNAVLNPVTKEAMPMRVIAKGMHDDSTPLTALSIGAKYSVNGWYFEAAANYYDRVYVGFSPYRRLNSTYATDGRFYTPSSFNAAGQAVYEPTLAQLQSEGGILFDAAGNEVKSYAAEQEKFKGGIMLDASVGRSFRLKGGRSLNVNLSFQNITNNTNLRTGGYEQNRSDNYYSENGGVYTKGEGKAYKFSRNSKYYYANAFNVFLNIGYRF